MLATIVILGPPIRYTEYETEFEIEAATPAEALSLLAQRFPDLHRFLYEEGGQFKSYLRFFVDSESCPGEAMHATRAGEKVEICVTVPVTGG